MYPTLFFSLHKTRFPAAGKESGASVLVSARSRGLAPAAGGLCPARQLRGHQRPCVTGVFVLGRPRLLLVLVLFGSRGKWQCGVVCSLGRSVCMPLPFRGLKGERRRRSVWELIRTYNLLTCSAAANRVFWGGFLHVWLVWRYRTKLCEVDRHILKKESWFVIFFFKSGRAGVRSACLSVYFPLIACLLMGCTLVPRALGFDCSVSLLFLENYLYFIKSKYLQIYM